MKVTEVQAAYPKWRHLPLGGAWQAHFWQIAVRVVTDVEVVGHGYGGGQPAVHVINDHLSRFLVGRTIGDVGDIAAAWDELYLVSIPYGRGGLAQMALSGVDLALWDALARAERCPVHRLIGPRSKGRVTAYATSGDLELTARYGYSAIKLSHRWRGKADYDSAAQRLAAARAAFGPAARLMVDCYLSWPVAVAARMAKLLAPYAPYWFEDVATPEHLAELAALRPRVKPRIQVKSARLATDNGSPLSRSFQLRCAAVSHSIPRDFSEPATCFGRLWSSSHMGCSESQNLRHTVCGETRIVLGDFLCHHSYG